ncbi:reverse transcriptase domain-containing protein [Tanacetum coccineum]
MRTRRSNYPNNSNVTIPRRRRRQVSNIVEPEIRTIVTPMAERTMEELLRAPTEGYGEAIVLPEINADHFEIKTNLLQLVQANPFYGRESENPHAHINSFKRITSTLRFRNVPNDIAPTILLPKKVVERGTEETRIKSKQNSKDIVYQLNSTCGYPHFYSGTELLRLCLNPLHSEIDIRKESNLSQNISYPSRRDDQKSRDKASIKWRRSSQIFLDLRFETLVSRPWVSPVHCVPKKGGITVVANEENELILTRLVTEWRITPFVFSKDCIDAFQTLKKKLIEAPILVVPDWNLPFELMCDASDFAIGAVLGHEEFILLAGFTTDVVSLLKKAHSKIKIMERLITLLHLAGSQPMLQPSKSKTDEGFFVGYSLNSKAFRVFNSRTKIVEENLHIRFSESTPNVVSSGPDWLFDIDALTRTMNYELIVADYDVGGKISIELTFDPNMPSLEDYTIFDTSRNDEDDGAEADMNNLDYKQSNYTNKKDVKEFGGT